MTEPGSRDGNSHEHYNQGNQGFTGETGEAGQDGAVGRPGRTGATGERGAPGPTLKINDKRLLVMYLFVVGAVFTMFSALSYEARRNDAFDAQFQRNIITNCERINVGNTKINIVLDQLGKTSSSDPELTPAQRAAALAKYESLMLPVTTCPPVR